MCIISEGVYQMVHVYFFVHFEFFPKVIIKKNTGLLNCSNKDLKEIQATQISCFLITCILDCGVLHRIRLFFPSFSEYVTVTMNIKAFDIGKMGFINDLITKQMPG